MKNGPTPAFVLARAIALTAPAWLPVPGPAAVLIASFVAQKLNRRFPVGALVVTGPVRRGGRAESAGVGSDVRLAADGEDELDDPDWLCIGAESDGQFDRCLIVGFEILKHARKLRPSCDDPTAANRVKLAVRVRIGQLRPDHVRPRQVRADAAHEHGDTCHPGVVNERSSQIAGIAGLGGQPTQCGDESRRIYCHRRVLPRRVRPRAVDPDAGLGSGVTRTSRQRPVLLLSVIRPTLGVGKCACRGSL